MYVCMYLCMYACIYVCMHVNMYVYVYLLWKLVWQSSRANLNNFIGHYSLLSFQQYNYRLFHNIFIYFLSLCRLQLTTSIIYRLHFVNLMKLLFSLSYLFFFLILFHLIDCNSILTFVWWINTFLHNSI